MSSVICAGILVLVLILAVGMTFFVNKILGSTVLKGRNLSFVLELSDYRKIKVGKIIVRSIFERTLFVLGRAVMVAAPAGILIYLLTNFNVGDISVLKLISNWLDPIGRLMGLDGIILLSFLLGFPANEIVMPIMLMVYLGTDTLTNYESLSSLKLILLDNGWTLMTAICFVIFTLFHFPCSTTLLTIKKETGSIWWMLLSFLLPLVIGIILCVLVHFFFWVFGILF